MKFSRRGFLCTAASISVGTTMLGPPHDASAEPEGAKQPERLNPWRLEPVDLRRFIRLGVEHIFTGATDPHRGYLPYVRFNLTGGPALSNHEYWGSPHMEGRFLDALARCAEVTDIPSNDQAVDGLRVLLHNTLDNPWGLPLWTLPDPDGKRTGNMHDCREVLLGLIGLVKWKKCERSLELARKLVAAMDEVTRPTGEYPSSLLGIEGWRLPPEPGVMTYTCGRAIGSLTEYYRLTKEVRAIDLAKRFADYCIQKAFSAEGDLADGAGTHLHSNTGTMASLLDLGALTGNQRYFEFGRRLFDVHLKKYRSSFGWAKESKNFEPQRGEANNSGDYIEAALTLAQNGAPEYYADVERFVRNGLLAAQIIDTGWIVQSAFPDTENEVYSHIRERARGGFAFTTPNGYHSYNTDLMGGALRALCKAYQAVAECDEDGIQINMLFPVDTATFSTTSQIPEAGSYTVYAKQARRIRIRLMEGVPDDAVRLTVGGESRDPRIQDHILLIDSLPADASATLAFNLPAHHTREIPPGWETCEIDWRGNTIVGMSPSQGPIALY